MADASNVRNVNPDKPDKAPDVTHGAPGQAHSSGAISSFQWCGETAPHDRHEHLVGFRRFDCRGVPGCTGSRFCEADTHIHGCLADNGDCDHPEEHDA